MSFWFLTKFTIEFSMMHYISNILYLYTDGIKPLFHFGPLWTLDWRKCKYYAHWNIFFKKVLRSSLWTGGLYSPHTFPQIFLFCGSKILWDYYLNTVWSTSRPTGSILGSHKYLKYSFFIYVWICVQVRCVQYMSMSCVFLSGST